MKKVSYIILISALVGSSINIASAQDDGIYYTPGKKTDKPQPAESTPPPQVQPVLTPIDSSNYYQNQNNQQQNTQQQGAANTNYNTSGRYYSDDDYYDYAYSARLRRFSNPYNNWGYYDNYYTNSYWYDYNPYNYGTSIYLGYNWWRPSYYGGFGYGFYDPFYSPYYGGFGYGYYGGGYGGYYGYNHGYYNDYYSGYGYNNGYGSTDNKHRGSFSSNSRTDSPRGGVGGNVTGGGIDSYAPRVPDGISSAGGRGSVGSPSPRGNSNPVREGNPMVSPVAPRPNVVNEKPIGLGNNPGNPTVVNPTAPTHPVAPTSIPTTTLPSRPLAPTSNPVQPSRPVVAEPVRAVRDFDPVYDKPRPVERPVQPVRDNASQPTYNRPTQPVQQNNYNRSNQDQRQQPSYNQPRQQPTYQRQQPTYQQSQPSYQQPRSSGGGYGGGNSGGGSRGGGGNSGGGGHRPR
jgi:hypothetical protein